MTGILLCDCSRAAGSSAALRRAAKAMSATSIFAALCEPRGIALAAARVKELKLHKLLLAGCPSLLRKAAVEKVSRVTGVHESAIDAIVLRPETEVQTIRRLRRACEGLELTPVFGMRRVPPCREVLVVGGSKIGAEVAVEIASLGYPTTLIQEEGPDTAPGIEVIPHAKLVSLTGALGAFFALISRKVDGIRRMEERTFGAVVVAPRAPAADTSGTPFRPDRVIPLSDLVDHIESLPRRDRPRRVAIVLDFRLDEGNAGSDAAMNAALVVRERFHAEVAILLRDVKVSSPGLEALYDRAREAGVTFVKYSGAMRNDSSSAAVAISCLDTVLGEEVEFIYDLAAVSAGGLPVLSQKELAAVSGIGMDAYGRLQENNVHLLPTRTNREGVFVVGACRGEAHEHDARRDVLDAAFSVHALLSRKTAVQRPAQGIDVELSHAVVDAEACALCLTCVRVCPFKAMRLDEKEKQPVCIPESCRGCGICVGECPARAIVLPAHTNAALTVRVGVQP